MWRAFARDVICMISAVIVMTGIGAALWFAAMLWLVPPTAQEPWWIFMPFLAPIPLALAGIGILFFWAPFRGRGRRGQPIRPPYWRDTLILPVMAGVALGLGCLLTALLTGKKHDAGTAFLMGLALTIPLALTAWFVVLVQRFTARPARALAIAAAALIALWLGGRLALDAWGGRMFAAYKTVAWTEIAAERQRIAADRRPVLFGAPIDDNAADRYRSITRAINEKLKDEGLLAIVTAAHAGPGKPRSADLAHWVEVFRPELQALREAVRCTRCDWHFAWEQGFAAPFPDFGNARRAGDLLVVEGHQRAEAGDVAGAVERDLEVIRMGSDYESSCALIGTLMAFAIESDGTYALLQLVAADGLAAQPAWDEVESKLDVLEPRLASVSVGFRGERLGHVGWESIADDDWGTLGWPRQARLRDLFFPGRFMMADAVRTEDEALREIEKANEFPDPREATRCSEVALDRALRSHNTLVQIGLPSLRRSRTAQDHETARFRILRAAIQLEKTWAKQGRYPANAAAINLPVDPFAYPAKLHYTSLADGRGYKLWSVGLNGTDDGGNAKDQADEVFVRPARPVAAHAHIEKPVGH